MRAPQEDRSSRASYQNFIRAQIPKELRTGVVPVTARAWEDRLARVRAALSDSFGRLPASPCDLRPEVLGTLVRDGYAIERLTFESRPQCRVTANVYRPEPVAERYPGVLSVHGHWAWARMDPHVQPRCIALAKLGYVVLCVDAFGAGERAVEPGAGTYHGGLVGASLWPVGTPLLGLQVYDNRRAVDYLISRPDVNPLRLAITGASGGGNQTLYAGATDERLSAVIPVCGVGTYDSYLQTACCVCEVNLGGAAYATTGDLLALVAPRALLVISATRDALQFSVGEAAKSVAFARERFRSLSAEEKIRHVPIESGHDYNQPMREAMYGWVERWLKGRGDGSPIREPTVRVEEVATLRCYPDGASRPKTIVTIPEFVRREAEARLAAFKTAPDHRERWIAEAERMRAALRSQVLGTPPGKAPAAPEVRETSGSFRITMTVEEGVRSTASMSQGEGKPRGTVLLLDPGPGQGGSDGRPSADSPLDQACRRWSEAGFTTLALAQPRGSGPDLTGTEPVANVRDHTVAEWALWVGRPLLGQWVWDILRWLDWLDELRVHPPRAASRLPVPERPYAVVGFGTMSLPAIIAGGLDDRVAGVGCSECLLSVVGSSGKALAGVAMGVLAPRLLDPGDVCHLCALVAPRPLKIGSGRLPEGGPATPEQIRLALAYCRSVYGLLGAKHALQLATQQELWSFLDDRRRAR
jgi:dienelactone hydrolase